MTVKTRSKKWSFWAVTLVSAITLLSPMLPLASNPSPDPKLVEAYELEDRAEELKVEGKYSEAIPLIQQALAIWENELGMVHPHVARRVQYLAILYKEQGNYAQAELLIKRALAIREKVPGEEEYLRRSLISLASLYRERGNYTQVEPLLERSLALSEKMFSKEDRYAAQALNDLALLYQKQGNYSQAESLYQRSLAISEKLTNGNKFNLSIQAGDTDAIDKVNTLSNLATLYLAQGNYSQAEVLLKRTLTLHEDRAKPNSNDIAANLNSLGSLYSKQGQFSEAEPLLKRALALVETQEQENVNSATVFNNLALLYQAQGKYNQAEPLLKRSLTIREKVLGQEHPDVASNFSNLSSL